MRYRISAFTLLLTTASLLSAANVFTVTAPSGFGFSDTAQVVAFRTTTYYANVTISMPLKDESSGGPIAGTEGTAYLVNAIGASATEANEAAAPVTISGLTGAFASRTLWSGITLPPGTYYVVLVAAANTTPALSPSLSAEGGSSGSMVVTTGTGVSDVGARVTSSAIAPFPPASNFGGFNPPSQIFITVTGTATSALFTATAPSGFGFSDTVQAVAFRTTTFYMGVSISMPLKDESSGGPIAGTEGTAYLVNAIGASATAANLAAPPVTISGLTSQFAPVTLWSGISLPPGTYYVVVAAAANTTPALSPSLSAEGGSSGSMVVTTGTGVSDVGARVTSSAIAPFPPASNFGGFNPPSQIFITVTGTATSALFTATAPSGFGFSDTAQAVAFRTTTAYTNVSISMPLKDESSGGPIAGTEGTAYLVNAIGAGTTTANQAAPPVTISGLTDQFAPVTLWSGISLPPGTYYIVLAAAANTTPALSPSLSAEGGSSGSMVITTGVGVSDVGARVTSTAITPFAPASNFGGFNPPSQIFVLVTGDPAAAPPSVPAVSQWAVAILALLLMGVAARLLAKMDWGASTPGAGA